MINFKTNENFKNYLIWSRAQDCVRFVRWYSWE